MTFTFNHFNFNVKNLEESIRFYNEALGLKEMKRKEAKDGSYILVFLGDGKTNFSLELTWLKEHPGAYDLGELEYHLAMETDDYESSYKKHQNMGCVCYTNDAMGIYFIHDPDGYWIEIVPAK
ncbi:lactoylglutathione lyase [bacterium 1XD42-8]|nr:lactoylglutathione lyase [bacterium 1XD42-8]